MAGGWEDWRWDETLFAGAAPYYVKGRVPYAPGLADALADALALDGGGRLLDVGCGPGVVALRLAHLFEEVVGVDPDPGMVAEAEHMAEVAGVTIATWRRLRAEDLPSDLGQFRVATFAASFHWMDRRLVAGLVRPMIEPGGAVVQVHAPPPTPDPFAAGGVIDELRLQYLGPGKRAGQSIRNTSPSGEDAVFVGAGFPPAEEIVVPDGRLLERTLDDLVANALSASSTAPHLFGDRLADFEADLRDRLAAASHDGVFPMRLADNELRIWRKG